MEEKDEQFIADVLASLKRIEPDPAILSRVKMRISDAMPSFPESRFPKTVSFRFALVPAFLGLAAMITSVAFASQQSLPEDFLYPLKLASEQARVALTLDSRQKIALELALAELRLQEARQLSMRPGFNNTYLISETIGRYEERLSRAKDMLRSLQSSHDVGNDETVNMISQTVQSMGRSAEILDSIAATSTDTKVSDAKLLITEILDTAKEAVMSYALGVKSDDEFRAISYKTIEILRKRLAPIQLAFLWSSDEPAAIEDIAAKFSALRQNLAKNPIPREEVISQLREADSQISDLEKVFKGL